MLKFHFGFSDYILCKRHSLFRKATEVFWEGSYQSYADFGDSLLAHTLLRTMRARPYPITCLFESAQFSPFWWTYGSTLCSLCHLAYRFRLKNKYFANAAIPRIRNIKTNIPIKPPNGIMNHSSRIIMSLEFIFHCPFDCLIYLWKNITFTHFVRLISDLNIYSRCSLNS